MSLIIHSMWGKEKIKMAEVILKNIEKVYPNEGAKKHKR
jgi:hypothetical protein